MNAFDLILEWFTNPSFTNRIIIIQIPIVLCLTIQCYQAYKFGFRSYKLLSIAWGVNLLYILFNIFLNLYTVDEVSKATFNQLKFSLATFSDLISISVFLFAVYKIKFPKHYQFLKGTKIGWYIVFGTIAASIKNIPGYLDLIPFIHLRYLPTAIFNFFTLSLLAYFFKSFAKTFKIKNFHSLFYFTYAYAVLQFLSILRPEAINPTASLVIDNAGFTVGLILKTGILIFLSKIIVEIINVKRTTEKQELLEHFAIASNDFIELEKQKYEKYFRWEEHIYAFVLKKMLYLLKEDLGFFASYDDERKKLRITCVSPKYEAVKGFEYNVDQGLSGIAVTTRKSQIKKSRKDGKPYFNFPENNLSNDLDSKVQSALAFPLIVDDAVLGVFVIESFQEDYFSDLELLIMNELVDHTLFILKRGRLMTQLENSKLFLDSLKQIDKEILHEREDLGPVIDRILNQALKLVNAVNAYGNIDILDEKNKNLLVCIASTNKSNIGEKSDIYNCISGLAVLHKKHFYIEDIINADEKIKKQYKNRLGKGYKCELVIPLILKNEVIGVFNIETKEAKSFNDKDIETIEGFAGQVAIAIYITKLLDRINEKNMELSDKVDQNTITSIDLYNSFIKHRIGNKLGSIENKIVNKLLDSQKSEAGIKLYGTLSDKVKKELHSILQCVEEAFDARGELKDVAKKLKITQDSVVDYREIEKWIIEKVRPNIKENVSIEIYGFDSLNSNIIDLKLLKEIFAELIYNAEKAILNSGKIIITGKSEPKGNVFTFNDTGAGIPKEDYDNIFLKGWSKFKGSGIGLYDVRLTITIWGGKIKVHSKLGVGTTFTVEIPYLN